MDMALHAGRREQAAADDRLYDQCAARWEATHQGHSVSSGQSGEILGGPDDIALLDQALATVGSGKVASPRLGQRALGRFPLPACHLQYPHPSGRPARVPRTRV